MINEKDREEFKQWQRIKNQTQLDAAFYDLQDMLDSMKGHTITMPSRAFKLLATALVLLKEEIKRD
ncbi:MAG TPA: hypothetical protein VHZ50_05230 [Puia sp.]|jgi:hypothetical protein|nr:hypothetical protein [Puia sp.]